MKLRDKVVEKLSQDGLMTKYFILTPYKENEYGLASRVAMLSYAAFIKKSNPKLCQDLVDWVKEIEGTNGSD